MKKKLLALVLVAAMILTLAACGNGSKVNKKAKGSVTIWVAEAVVDYTKTVAEAYLAENFPNYTVVVEAVGEGDAAGNMITDVQGGADIYGFAQDQLSRLVSAGAVMPITGDYKTWAEKENAGGVTAAATVGDVLYAFPMTADNGYFLYYDKSVVSDPSTLEGILADCKKAGKNFYYDFGSWYNYAFFTATGCHCTYATDADGAFTSCDVNFATNEGVAALKAMIALAESGVWQAGSSVSNAVDWAGIVDGTWDKAGAVEVLGDNYACAKLPTFTVDGKTYQMGGFNGCKLLGVKPQEDATKLAVCLGLAQALTNESAQLARFNQFGWGPSNLAAQANEAVQADAALSALAEQFSYTVGQGQYPGDFWSTGIDGDLASGTLNSGMSDAELLAYLTNVQVKLEAAK